MSRINFGNIQLNGKFIHNSCLFIKGDNNQGTIVGSKDSIRFEDDFEVGEVVSEAHAPEPEVEVVDHVEPPEAPQEDDSEE